MYSLRYIDVMYIHLFSVLLLCDIVVHCSVFIFTSMVQMIFMLPGRSCHVLIALLVSSFAYMAHTLVCTSLCDMMYWPVFVCAYCGLVVPK